MKTHAEFVEALPLNWLECRDLRHTWVADQNVYRTVNGLTVRVLDCSRCGATKYQLIDGTRVVSSSMKFPVGYVKGKAVEKGRINRSTVVGESIGRMKQSKVVPDDVVLFMERRGMRSQ